MGKIKMLVKKVGECLTKCLVDVLLIVFCIFVGILSLMGVIFEQVLILVLAVFLIVYGVFTISRINF